LRAFALIPVSSLRTADVGRLYAVGSIVPKHPVQRCSSNRRSSTDGGAGFSRHEASRHTTLIRLKRKDGLRDRAVMQRPLVGTRKGRRLLYRGTVEWGMFRQLVGQLVAGVEGLVRPTSPFADLKLAAATWFSMERRLVGKVSYSELMEDRLDPVL